MSLAFPRGVLLCGFVLGGCLSSIAPLAAEELRVHGSSTFNRTLLLPFRDVIEAQADVQLKVISSRSGLGVVDLVEGRADMAMISAPLKNELDELRRVKPNSGYDKLQAFEVSQTRIAFVVHPSNPISSLTQDVIRRILKGEISTWSEIGGPSLPIRPVHVPNEGGVTQVVISSLLDGKPIQNAKAIRVDTPTQIIKVVSQEPGALGLAQLRLAKESGLKELSLDQRLTQVLVYVTKGAPTPAMQRLIDVTRSVAEKNLASAASPR